MQQALSLFRTWSFGPLAMLSMWIALFVFWRRAKEEHHDDFEILDLGLVALFWGIIVSRVSFILLHWSVFKLEFWKWVSPFEYPGYVAFAGLIAGVVAFVSMAKKQKQEIFALTDLGSIALSLGLGLVHIVAFINGSGFGTPTSMPWGMQVPGLFETYHPIQLYAAPVYLLLSLVLNLLEKRYRSFTWYRASKRAAQPGFLTGVFLIVFGVLESALSFVRPPTLNVAGFGLESMLFVFCIVGGVLVFLIQSGRIPTTKKAV